MICGRMHRVLMLALGIVAFVFTGLFPQYVQAQTAIVPGTTTDAVIAYIHTTTFLSVLIGVILFSLFIGALLMRARKRLAMLKKQSGDEITALRASLGKTETLLNARDDYLISLNSDNTYDVIGVPDPDSLLPTDRTYALAFGSWLPAPAAQKLDEAVTALRGDGEDFDFVVPAKEGRFLHAIGYTAAGRTLLQLREASREQQRIVELERDHGALKNRLDTLLNMLDAFDMPVWQRNARGELEWVNDAYAKAVEVQSPQQVVDENITLLEEDARRQIADQQTQDPVFIKQLAVVLAGQRHMMDVRDVVSDTGSAGVAIDISELDRIATELQRTIDYHARTLDQLTTAVSIFNSDHKLQFFNAAFEKLWRLEPNWLDTAPRLGTILDRLRAKANLPIEVDYSGWKETQLAAFRAVEASEDWWHLPDGRTLRVIANPHPTGGVTFVYEDVTDYLALETRFKMLTRLQGETLDHLREGVAVFGSNGRLWLSNPALASIWNVTEHAFEGRPHVDALIALFAPATGGSADAWREIKACITGVADSRETIFGRFNNKIDDKINAPQARQTPQRVIDYAAIPLPDGATMVTFADVTDSTRVERALKERNDALEAADHLKSAFVGHVSYELRSPLTNIIGFAQLLADDQAGALNEKQRQYVEYIMSSSSSLLAIINDILDLTTVDAGIMELDYEQIDVRETVKAIADGVQGRLLENHISLLIEIADNIDTFIADRQRLRQALFNLVLNAISFSDPGSAIKLSCWRDEHSIVFTVEDNGCGMPQEYVEMAFERFESRGMNAGRRGPGLGLAIVKSFVELHHGKVEIDSSDGEGTRVVCRFPDGPERIAASHAAA